MSFWSSFLPNLSLVSDSLSLWAYFSSNYLNLSIVWFAFESSPTNSLLIFFSIPNWLVINSNFDFCSLITVSETTLAFIWKDTSDSSSFILSCNSVSVFVYLSSLLVLSCNSYVFFCIFSSSLINFSFRITFSDSIWSFIWRIR